MKRVWIFVKKIMRWIKALRLDENTLAYVAHNKRIFLSERRGKPKTPVLLFELNEQHSSIIAYSYLANVLASKHDADIVAYLPTRHVSWLGSLAWRFLQLLNPIVFSIYGSFGVQGFLAPKLDSVQLRKAQNLFDATLANINTKADIESLCINGVWIGDLVYDSYLMNYNRPTIDRNADDFHASLKNSIKLYVFWEDYISNHDVRAVSVSHCVYDLAIPLRIAVIKNIAVYQINATHVYRLDAKNLFAYNDFYHYRRLFGELPRNVQEAGLKEAEARINRRLAGEVGVDMAYSKKSAYGGSKGIRLVKESSRKKILIATHCFFDSPHSYGNNLSPDFYEWLDFLGQMTQKTDYDWYIKTHPDYLPGTKEIIDSFVEKYPRFTLLPADSSHHQLIAEGIDVALTVYGTIAFEYAALGMPVINASAHNPHVAYDFNLHPKSIEEYECLLLNLEELALPVDKQQVYEYYFMKHIYSTENWLFKDYSQMIEDIGGYKEQFTPKVYEKWLSEWTPEKHTQIIKTLQQFVDSGDFRLDHRHCRRGLTVQRFASTTDAVIVSGTGRRASKIKV